MLGYSGVLPEAGQNWFDQLILGTLGQWVDALFVISGFVVFLPTVARGGNFGSVGAYAIRRAARLVPAYWLMLAIIALLLVAVPLTPPLPFPSVAAIGIHLGFLQTPAGMFADNIQMGFGADGPVWTLSVEIAFYLVLPLIAGWYFRRPIVGLVLAAVLTSAWHEAFLHFNAVTSAVGVTPTGSTALRLQVASLLQFPYWAFSFAAGMTGAWAYVRARGSDRPALVAKWSRLAQVAGLVGLIAFSYVTGHRAVHTTTILGDVVARREPWIALGYSGSLALLMVATALGSERWQRPFAHPFARWLGDISYGIYLVHMVIATFALRAFGLVNDGTLGAFLAISVIVIPASVAYGYLSARYVEQPIRRWARRYGRRLQPGAGPTAGAGVAAGG
jgi:peptidoglycan/LPS O-acetylase OafA/YrhL